MFAILPLSANLWCIKVSLCFLILWRTFYWGNSVFSVSSLTYCLCLFPSGLEFF
ncbi:hypothetical protein UPYG_G00062560 [Umbra pygmaea]|uniref:Uncharacterized protein n=1 Tax=Umbra pygmaea TaxID=75934 RepID=A0ABD0XAB0_UMBPY